MIAMAEALCKEEKRAQPETEALPRPTCVCFVCTGNTCRSPMAAAVANAMAEAELAQYPDAVRDAVSPRLVAISRGLYAADGEPISENAVLALEGAGIAPSAGNDYHSHTARAVCDADVENTDLFVAVCPGHAMELLMRFPNAAQRIVCMPRAISDPWGGDLGRYATCLREITDGVRELLFNA